MKENMNNKELSLIEQLFDENNTDPIVLYDAKNKAVEFEQIAIIPYKEDAYVILKPITKIDGVSDDEALVFYISEDEDALVIADDCDVIDAVFAIYYDMLNQ